MTKLLYSLLSGHVIPRPSLKLSVIPADDDDDDDDEASYNGDDRPFQSCLSLDGMMNIEMLDQEILVIKDGNYEIEATYGLGQIKLNGNALDLSSLLNLTN